MHPWEPKMFVIEDEIHAEEQGHFPMLRDALAELRRRAAIPWDESPNVAPCMSWQTCGREYVVIEYDDAARPWKELSRRKALEISAKGITWVPPFDTA